MYNSTKYIITITAMMLGLIVELFVILMGTPTPFKHKYTSMDECYVLDRYEYIAYTKDVAAQDKKENK